jgi:hypothetical protein
MKIAKNSSNKLLLNSNKKKKIFNNYWIKNPSQKMKHFFLKKISINFLKKNIYMDMLMMKPMISSMMLLILKSNMIS